MMTLHAVDNVRARQGVWVRIRAVGGVRAALQFESRAKNNFSKKSANGQIAGVSVWSQRDPNRFSLEAAPQFFYNPIIAFGRGATVANPRQPPLSHPRPVNKR